MSSRGSHSLLLSSLFPLTRLQAPQLVKMMAPAYFLSSLLLCSLCNALAFKGPVVTPMAQPGQRVQAVNEERPTPAPVEVEIDLYRRDDVTTITIGEALMAPDNIFGYFSVAGQPGSMLIPLLTSKLLITYSAIGSARFTCGDTENTAVLVFPQSVASENGYVGCCLGGYCDFVKTCINSYDYYSSSACDANCVADTATMIW